MAFFKRALQLGEEGKWPPRCISGYVSPRDKIPKAIPMFCEGKLFNGPHANLARWFLYPEIQDGSRKPEVVLMWHVRLYLNDIWVDYYVFLVGKLNATMVIHTRIHLDVTFQDGGKKAPQPHWIWDRRHANTVNIICKTKISSGLWSPSWKIDLQ